MEVAILAGLAGLGYAVTRATDKTPTEGFKNKEPVKAAKKNHNSTKLDESYINYQAKPSKVDNAYKVSGSLIPSEPNPGKQGNAFAYATQSPPLMSLDADKPRIAMRADRIEETPNYIEAFENQEGKVYSSLLGSYIDSNEFTHQNMVPFYGGSVKQNMTPTRNQSILDKFTGNDSIQIEKREVETMFDTGKTPYGSPYGLEMKSEFVSDRIVASRNRAGERPFEPTRVAPGIGQGGGALGSGGFHQMEVNDIMRPRDTNQLRTADNPKLTYKGMIVPGKHYIGKASENPGEVRKYRPDRFHANEGGEYLSATPAGLVKEAFRSTQIILDTTREETSQEYIGGGGAQGFGDSYVSGSYRAPMTQQFGGAGYRNANMTNYYTEYIESDEADYGRGSFENRDNERTATSERGVALNPMPAESGAVAVHYEDDARPTRRGETIGTARPVGAAGTTVPTITVWDPMDVARTTIKEGTVDNGRILGNAQPAAAPARLTVYDPEDLPKKTQKQQLSNKSYTGLATGVSNQAFASQSASKNMRQSAEREVTLNRRKPTAGNGGMALFNSEINQTSKSITKDVINDRAMGADRVVGLTPGKADIGVSKMRAPLKLNQSADRFGPEMVSALHQNPYAKPLFSQ
jgi:hypothetical protein